ncbi:MAG: ATP-binding cassette domain-containing protein [Oscillospiraceae bacterium]|jgi:molybdate transport system ATP-binding protein|nr:ATP-binding cassette domain-containing protein [Oscillospiraceae bacterium]
MPLTCKIEKDFGAFKLDVDIETEDEIRALLGASGCGKSMTLRCIAGVVKPDNGLIILNGITLFDSKKRINLSPQQRQTGFLFQDYALFPNMSVAKNIAAGVHKKDRSRKTQIVREMIASFQLEGFAHLYPAQLSGGQKQRCALARIMAGQPEILLLDEPFSALDSHLKWQLEQELTAMIACFSGPVLFVSHNRDEVYRICENITILNNGKSELTGAKKDIFKNPVTRAAALLMGCKNIVAAAAEGNKVLVDDWGFSFVPDSIPESLGYVGIRANHIQPAYEALSRAPVRFAYEILYETEGPFNHIMTVRKAESNCQPIRWEMPKATRKAIDDHPHELCIQQEQILLLR